MEDSLEYMAARLRNIKNLEPAAPVVRMARVRPREAAWGPALAVRRNPKGQTNRLKVKSREHGR